MPFDIRPLMSAAFWFGFLLWLVIILIPVVRLLKRTGHHTAWSLLFVIPLVNVVALWIFAFKSWPIDRKPAST